MHGPTSAVLGNGESFFPIAKWQKAIDLMVRIYEARAGFIVQHTVDGYVVASASDNPSNPYAPGTLINAETNIFCRKVVREQTDLYVRNATELAEWESNPEVNPDGFNSYLGYLIRWSDGTPFGTICVMDYAKTDYQDVFLELMGQFRDLIEADLALVEQYREQQRLSLTDELTGLCNRRALNLYADHLFRTARRYRQSLGIYFIDLDQLKTINDHQGHAQGDRALRIVAQVLSDNIRESDLLARVGGDEFIILTLLDDHEPSERLTERIQTALEACNQTNSDVPVQVSIGCTITKPDNERAASLGTLLAEADQAMYQTRTYRS